MAAGSTQSYLWLTIHPAVGQDRLWQLLYSNWRCKPPYSLQPCKRPVSLMSAWGWGSGHSWSAGCCETQATRAPAYSLAPSCFAQHSFSGQGIFQRTSVQAAKSNGSALSHIQHTRVPQQPFSTASCSSTSTSSNSRAYGISASGTAPRTGQSLHRLRGSCYAQPAGGMESLGRVHWRQRGQHSALAAASGSSSSSSALEPLVGLGVEGLAAPGASGAADGSTEPQPESARAPSSVEAPAPGHIVAVDTRSRARGVRKQHSSPAGEPPSSKATSGASSAGGSAASRDPSWDRPFVRTITSAPLPEPGVRQRRRAARTPSPLLRTSTATFDIGSTLGSSPTSWDSPPATKATSRDSAPGSTGISGDSPPSRNAVGWVGSAAGWSSPSTATSRGSPSPPASTPRARNTPSVRQYPNSEPQLPSSTRMTAMDRWSSGTHAEPTRTAGLSPTRGTALRTPAYAAGPSAPSPTRGSATGAAAYAAGPTSLSSTRGLSTGAAPDMQRSGVGRVGPAFPTPQQAEAAAPRLNMADFLAAAKRLQDRLTLAVKVESEEQIADIRRLYRSQSLKALQDSSAMLTSLVARPLEQLLGDFVWCLSAKMRSRREGAMPALPYHRFAAGDSVLLVALDAKGSVPRGQDTASLEATVFRVTQNQVHVAVGPWNSDIMEAAGPDRLWRMDRLSQEVTTKRQLAAIDQLDIPPCITREAALNLDPQDMASLWRGNLGIRMILAGSPEAAARAKHLPAWARSQLWRRDAGEQLRDIKTLNASQRRAIATAIAGSLTLWQGPPGTGKTRTLLALIQVLVGTLNTPKRLEEMGAVLACGDTNAAVDNLVEGLLAAGIKVVRLGQPAKVRPSLWPATMEAQALLTPKGQLAEKMRAKSAKEMERYRQGGYLHESLDRDALEQVKSEAKGLLSRASKLIAEASRDVIESSEVVAATCTGSGDAQRLGGRRFKMVVIDEATQATEPSTLIPLVQGAECVVLAGDPNQLPPTVISQKALKMGLDRTLFDRLLDMGISANLLDTQYRMHPLIAELPSQLFYGGLLKSGISAADRPTPASSIWPNPACPVVLVECEGAGERRSSGINQTSAEEGGNSYNNEEEAKLALRALWSLSESGPLGSVAILTPYNGQVRLLNNLLKEAGNPVLQHVEISSVDGYQGREADVIVFSTVRNNPAGTLGFVSDARRLNVAITRAKHALVVVGSAQTLANDRNWRAWLSWMKARHAIVSADTLPLAPWDA